MHNIILKVDVKSEVLAGVRFSEILRRLVYLGFALLLVFFSLLNEGLRRLVLRGGPEGGYGRALRCGEQGPRAYRLWALRDDHSRAFHHRIACCGGARG